MSFPSLGGMIAEQIVGLDTEETDQVLEESHRKRLYWGIGSLPACRFSVRWPTSAPAAQGVTD